MATPPTGTVDLTDMVEKLKKAWVEWAVQFVVSAAVAAAPQLMITLLQKLLGFVVEKVASVIAGGAEMQGFFLNTAIRKGAQAQDFVDAADALDNLPTTTTDEEYEEYEKRKMLAFRNLAMVTN